jgi:hypothetical protein
VSNKIIQNKNFKPDYAKKPYIKKLMNFAGFDVWVVDGEYIRKNISEDFVNYDQHFHLNFIPKNEFWIEKNNIHNETKFYIDHLFIESRLMASGKNYETAYLEAAKFEKKERAKSECMKNIDKSDKKHLLGKVKEKLWKACSKKIKVYIVNGELVRDLFFIDFADGGHDKVYSFIPEAEIWIDDDIIHEKERKFILLHEMHERNCMAKGATYSEGHASATEIEDFCRKHPKETDKFIKKEMLKNI